MNKIDLNAVLPKAPERVPAPPAAGSRFQEQLGLGRSDDAGQQQADLQQQRKSRSDAGEKIRSLDMRASGDVLRAELYGLSALAQQHLSYRTVDAGLAARHAAEEGRMSSFSAASLAATVKDASTLAPGTIMTRRADTMTGTGLPAELAGSSPGHDETAAMPASAGTSFMAAVNMPSRLLRKISFLTSAQGTEVVVRDYDRESDGESNALLTALRRHCDENNIPLTRIVLNGTELWSAATESRE